MAALFRRLSRLSGSTKLSAFRHLRSVRFSSHGAPSLSVSPPITLLGGFLGAGKTSTLTHLLTNREGLRIAILVNDVAEVNVDAISLRRHITKEEGIEMVQLENGCVCCSAAGELVPAVSKLLESSEPPFDHVVLELSGVADPANVQQSLGLGDIDVARKVALVDASSFPELYSSTQKAGERKDLTGPSHSHDEGDEPPHACVVERPVVELLMAQIETADVILANKCDLASDDELRATLNACRVLNDKAAIVATTFGDAALWDVLPTRASASAAASATAAEQILSSSSELELMLNGINCGGCANSLRRALMAVKGVSDVLAQTKTESGSHPNKVAITGSCTEEAVRRAIASLDAGRGKFTIVEPDAAPQTYEEISCSPPRPLVPNSADELGFVTHVFRARRPFNHQRLVELCDRWPLPNKQMCLSQFGAQQGVEPVVWSGPGVDMTFAGVLRSKGTIWLDTAAREPVVWSHAGRHLQLAYSGVWWASLPEPVMRQCLPTPEAFDAERALFEGDDGDRRQELVFIGTKLNEAGITGALDACLCTDEELRDYRVTWADAYAEAAPFRFDIGVRVECLASEDDKWSTGVVVAHHYRESGWPTQIWAPYQVQLDDGFLIYAPVDDKRCIRAASDHM